METCCRDHLRRRRIWLDVLAYKLRVRHVQQTIDSRLFDTGEPRGQKRLLLPKEIAADPGAAQCNSSSLVQLRQPLGGADIDPPPAKQFAADLAALSRGAQ